MHSVVAPVLHRYLYGGVPPAAFAHSSALEPAHTSLVGTEAVGFGFTVTEPASLPLQPFASVTVTEYAPAVPVWMHAVVAPVFHRYLYGGWPLVAFAHSSTEPPAQTSRSATAACGLGSGLNGTITKSLSSAVSDVEERVWIMMSNSGPHSSSFGTPSAVRSNANSENCRASYEFTTLPLEPVATAPQGAATVAWLTAAITSGSFPGGGVTTT